jgi:hypothetical protein
MQRSRQFKNRKNVLEKVFKFGGAAQQGSGAELLQLRFL